MVYPPEIWHTCAHTCRHYIDWVLSRTTDDRRRGIRWTLSAVVGELDYAHDIALLSRSFNDMEEKSDRLNRFARQVWLTISPNKAEVLPINISEPLPIKIGQLHLPVGSTVCNEEEPTWTFDRGLAALEEPSQNYDPCGGAESTAETQRVISTKLVYSLYYSLDQNVGE